MANDPKPAEHQPKAKEEKPKRLLAGGLDPDDTPQVEIPGTDPLAEDYDSEKDPLRNPQPAKEK